jgi:hypothetical protein
VIAREFQVGDVVELRPHVQGNYAARVGVVKRLLKPEYASRA